MKSSVFRASYYMAMVLCFLLTPYIVVMCNLWVGAGGVWVGISLLGLVLTLATGLGLCHELGLEKKNVFLFPLGAILMVMIMISSMLQTLLLRRTEWRGRIYEQ